MKLGEMAWRNVVLNSVTVEAYCGLTDIGIGPYEFWGVPCVDVRVVWVIDRVRMPDGAEINGCDLATTEYEDIESQLSSLLR